MDGGPRDPRRRRHALTAEDQGGQEAAATSHPVGVTLPRATGRDTVPAGFRPLGVRRPANLLRRPSTHRARRPPSDGSTRRRDGRAGATARYADARRGRIAERLPARRPRYAPLTLAGQRPSGPTEQPRGGACDGAPPPDPAERPEPPPPGVLPVLDQSRATSARTCRGTAETAKPAHRTAGPARKGRAAICGHEEAGRRSCRPAPGFVGVAVARPTADGPRTAERPISAPASRRGDRRA